MAWLSRNDLTPADRLYADQLNSLSNDIRTWGGNVNGGGNHLANVILDSSVSFPGSLQTPWITNVNGASHNLINVAGIGVGTAAPTCALEVVQAVTGGRANITFENNVPPNVNARMRIRLGPTNGFMGTDLYPYIEAANDGSGTDNATRLAFGIYGAATLSEAMRITSGGTVAIGTVTPAAVALHVAAHGIAGSGIITVQDLDVPSTGNTNCSITGLGSDAARCWFVGNGGSTFPKHLILWNDRAGDIMLGVNNIERMRITSAGAFVLQGLASTNPGAGSKQLYYDPADGNRVKYAP